ncbi:Nitroreductase-like protein [Phaeosphaeria sp. MPI-PUGE-AT-0046c]|nr:Nitroreductase-like protein [Phaeosphaeria sp. MPI-PUGE-AT-0046c]
MASDLSFLDAIAKRRSAYALTNTSPISQARITQLVHESLKYCPSAFNVRSGRCIILFGEEHTALWAHAMDIMPSCAPKELYTLLVPRIEIFKKAYGTVLFFDDPSSISKLPPLFQPLFTEFPNVQDHASGMLQFVVWTALAAEGLGTNLQHYQPHIDPWVREKYNVPETWKLEAQLVFGEMVDGPGPEKERTGLQESLKVFGGDS